MSISRSGPDRRRQTRSSSRLPGCVAAPPMPRRDRLESVLTLAQVYRGWTLRSLAESLGRDPHKLVPESGIPKLDLVMRLAETLDWSIDDVAMDLCGRSPGAAPDAPLAMGDFRELDRAAFEAYGANRFREMLEIARQALAVASAPEERARALTRQLAALDGLGLYRQALDVAQRALRETEIPLEHHLSFRANLANAHYTIGNIYEAESLAGSLVEWFARNPLPSECSKSTRAFASYVRGSCHRVLAGLRVPQPDEHARWAERDLGRAERMLDEYAAESGHDLYAGYANVCRGGALEVAPLTGAAPPDAVLERFLSALDAVVDPSRMPRGAWLESWGWWCIFGCNVALRHVPDEARLQTLMAVFTNKADEVAEHLGNWALRERVWTLELERRRRAGATTDVWVMDDDDVRVVAGTMARFPMFREVGWQVLRTARRIGQ
ncbi:MAG TPA: hypothetical protein PKC43_13560 [Phycisphaerales bacterium]|nr:hypothetical protein [Phycisphaerales bacterium]HMP38459.1 hypothetical protein [Phycisphaerales bacterium]